MRAAGVVIRALPPDGLGRAAARGGLSQRLGVSRGATISDEAIAAGFSEPESTKLGV
jgi:hypothetical protein